MNTTLNEVVFELMESRRNYIKDTDSLDRRIVVDWTQTMRARLLKQKLDQPMASIDDNYVQSLGALTMEKIASNELAITDYQYLYRTTIEVPRTIESKTGVGTFTRIGPADRLSEKFTVTTYEKALASGNGKFNHNSIYAFVLGERLCLFSKSGIHFGVKYIDVRGVFQNAIAAALIKNAAWTYNDNYPINKEIIDQMKVLIINEKFGLTLARAGDSTDDKEDNPVGQTSTQRQIPTNQTT